MEFSVLMRISVFLVLILIFYISGYYQGRARREGWMIKLQEDGWLVLALRIGFALPLLAVILLNIFYPSALFWSHFSSPLYLRITGLVLVISCVPFFLWVFRSLGDKISETVLTRDSHQLVTSGAYTRIRHPLYAGALLLLFSISLVFGDRVILGYSLVVALAFRLLVIPVEERQLLESFGEEYKCYQARTGALLPWIR